MNDTDNGATPAPYATNTLVKDGDIKILAWVGAGAMGVLVLFGLVLGQTGLLDFPDLPRSDTLGDYYVDTLIYRERRTALALILRTFITGFSFVVGLALLHDGWFVYPSPSHIADDNFGKLGRPWARRIIGPWR